MPLETIELSFERTPLPEEVAAFLKEADQRIDDYVTRNADKFNGFVASNYETIYYALREISELNLTAGNSFCEWGSGFGVVASLAAMLEFNSSGIEIGRDLVDGARELVEDFELPVEFVHGSFIPRAGVEQAEQACAESSSQYFWLVTDADDAYEELGVDPDDFDLVFAYPWPGEEIVIDELFEAHAAEGALLLTHDQFDAVRLQRKVR